MPDTAGLSQQARDLIAQGDALFSKRASLMSLWQEIAENFYPERADFTVSRTLGEDFAAHLNSSYPLLVRRELAGSIGAMTRRKDTEWFKLTVKRADKLDNSGREWLQGSTEIQRDAMYDVAANFETATSQADNDWATFGQCVLTVEVNWTKTALQYRCHHLRDVAWCDDEAGAVRDVHHKVKWTARDLVDKFGNGKSSNGLHQKVLDCLAPGKDPYTEFNCRRIVVPAQNYGDKARAGRFKWVSIYIDVDNLHMIDERQSLTPIYVIPRWQQVSGSQYAYSPAVVAGLPDARLIQAMTLTILEAGEMAVRPPMIAVGEVIQGGIKLFAGGITQVDAAYDERLGSPLRPAITDTKGLPFGIEVLDSKHEMLARAFYLNKLRSMPLKDQMTAYEASQWAKDYIREALPLFSPLESQYNAPVCEQTFLVLSAPNVNAFGPATLIPRSLRGRDTEWKFESPLSEAIERDKAQRFIESKGLITEAMALDPSTVATIDWRKAIRDALTGISVPAKWLRTEREVEENARAVAARQQQAAEAAAAQQGADTAASAGKAVESFAKVA